MDEARCIRILNTGTIYCPKLSELNDFHEAYNYYDLGDSDRLNDKRKNILADSTERASTRVLSLTKECNLTNPVMWAMYGGEGKGIAFSVKVIEKDAIRVEVDYEEKLTPQSSTEKSIKIKNIIWNFEKEVRYVFKPNVSMIPPYDKYTNTPYKKIIIEKIYLGRRIKLKTKRRIVNIARRKNITVNELSPFHSPKIGFRNVLINEEK